VGGRFNDLNGNARYYLVRLNSDGTEDTSFYTNLGSGFNDSVNTIAIQTDEKILIGGSFTELNGNIRNRLVRLNADGTEDTGFYTNLG
ncbi:delta-60 repeat domain-containing protein, partial [Lactococcus petauri]|uniref:delta-60 repeat domain-containing protein n=1 Tax=Lactococcus petauri TaxID=1940789 RepID=UPI0021F1BE67